MKCEICNVNDATIKLVEIINGERFKMHICMSCARKRGLTNPEANLSNIIEDAIKKLENRQKSRKLHLHKKKLTCPFCQTTAVDFRKTGRLGCKHCYSIFWPEVVNILNKYQGLNSEELPNLLSETQEEKISRLKTELRKVVKKEDYEKAAEIRDKINNLSLSRS